VNGAFWTGYVADFISLMVGELETGWYCAQMLSKLIDNAGRRAPKAKGAKNLDFRDGFRGLDRRDGQWTCRNAVQIGNPKNLIWTSLWQCHVSMPGFFVASDRSSCT
jgi:hypothetical protein